MTSQGFHLPSRVEAPAVSSLRLSDATTLALVLPILGCGALVHARGRIWGQLIFQDLFKTEQ